ncbi:hypothetical protein ACFQ1S_38650, partial [Kibdelosporangium lantanae]
GPLAEVIVGLMEPNPEVRMRPDRARVLIEQALGQRAVEEPPKGRKFGVKAAAKVLWRQGRMLMAISDELGKRPQGRFYHKALGMLPVVGMAGDYLGERSALKRAAKAANKWLRKQHLVTR